jgi:outer membrane protein assembly factor BamA
MTVDHRDQLIFPTSGVLLKLVQEYAGLGGDIAYVKHDSELQVNIPLPFELVRESQFYNLSSRLHTDFLRCLCLN